MKIHYNQINIVIGKHHLLIHKKHKSSKHWLKRIESTTFDKIKARHQSIMVRPRDGLLPIPEIGMPPTTGLFPIPAIGMPRTGLVPIGMPRTGLFPTPAIGMPRTG